MFLHFMLIKISCCNFTFIVGGPSDIPGGPGIYIYIYIYYKYLYKIVL